MATLFNYSPEDVDVLIAGVYNLSGFVEGSFVRISKDRPAFSVHETADGVSSRTHSESSLYSISLILHSASHGNEVLTYLHTADTFTKIAKFPVMIKDRMGSSVFFSPTSWIEGLPDSEYSTGITDRQWRIRCADSANIVGGNRDASWFIRDLTGLGSQYLDRLSSLRLGE